MKRSSRIGVVAIVAALAGCDSGDRSAAGSAMLRRQIETQAKTILRDVKAAEEQAATLEGGYVAREALMSRYLSRALPDGFELTIDDVSADAFRAVVVHRSSRTRCRLEVGRGSVAAVPTCDPAS